MYYVIVYSTVRDVPSAFAKRYQMSLSPGFYCNKARREFSSVTDAQNFAYSLLGNVKRDYCILLMGEHANGCIIYQEGK